MIPSIVNRRSIRNYQDKPVPRQAIEEILCAGCLAPSSKNRQPWRFFVAEGCAKQEMCDAMRRGLAREKKNPLLPESARHLSAAEYTATVMEQAPVVILVVNPLGASLQKTLNPEERVYEICNAQSIGACLQNMALAATEQGLGSLWICDTFFAYEELNSWLHTEGALVAAMAVGYAAESPPARPRKELAAVVEWRA